MEIRECGTAFDGCPGKDGNVAATVECAFFFYPVSGCSFGAGEAKAGSRRSCSFLDYAFERTLFFDVALELLLAPVS